MTLHCAKSLAFISFKVQFVMIIHGVVWYGNGCVCHTTFIVNTSIFTVISEYVVCGSYKDGILSEASFMWKESVM